MSYRNKILERYIESVTDISDLTAGQEPGIMFYLLVHCFGYLLKNEPDDVLSKSGIKCRATFNPVIKTLGRLFLSNPQVFENRNYLKTGSNTPDKEIILPETPVIWMANHAFKDDTLATILAIKRHAYILFGSVPQFYNTFDGVTAWLNGVIMTNRKVKASKQASGKKAIKAMEYGADLMMFPEGVWNKTPHTLILDLWPGIYRIAKESGALVVPVVHYLKDCEVASKDNLIHTVIDDPIRIDDLSEKAALEYLREVLAYWYFLMMEEYGVSTRQGEIKDEEKSSEVWSRHLTARQRTAARYDKAIEYSADYQAKEKVNQESVWLPVANIEMVRQENAFFVAFANRMLEEVMENDFQHRF